MSSAPAFSLRLWPEPATPPDQAIVAPPPAPPKPTRAERLRARRQARRKWTLRELYEQHVRPQILAATDLGSDSYELYELALTLWEQYTDNPPIGRITEETGKAWRERLKNERTWHGKPIAAATIRTRCRYAQMILDGAGPDRFRGRRRLPGARAFRRDLIPYLVPTRVDQSAREPHTIDEVWRWREWIAAHIDDPRPRKSRKGIVKRPPPTTATRPITRAAWFSAFVTTLYYTGMRPSTILDLRWEWISADGQWLTVPAESVKGKKHGLRIWLHPDLRDALDGIRLPTRARIFPWCRGPESKNYLFAELRYQQRAAGIRPFGCRGCRRLLATEVGRRNPLVAAWMLGHAPPREVRVMAAHYGHRDEIMRDVMSAYPPLRPATQRELF